MWIFVDKRAGSIFFTLFIIYCTATQQSLKKSYSWNLESAVFLSPSSLGSCTDSPGGCTSVDNMFSNTGGFGTNNSTGWNTPLLNARSQMTGLIDPRYSLVRAASIGALPSSHRGAEASSGSFQSIVPKRQLVSTDEDEDESIDEQNCYKRHHFECDTPPRKDCTKLSVV